MNSKTLGIIGGGQLGMFICIAARKIGLQTLVYSQKENFSAKEFCDKCIIGNIRSMEKIEKFIEDSDFYTVETENIHKDFLRVIEKKNNLYPSSNIIETAQNRLIEKKFLNSLKNIETAKFFEINSFNDLKESAKTLNFNCILKTQEFGYDGKGQSTIRKENLHQFENQILQNCILEEKIDFKLEVSVIVARSSSNIIVYPPVQNIHKESILRKTIFPAKIDRSLKNSAIEKAISISENLDLIGILAVEMFVTNEDQILINELAPRPHNSGHWTMDACKYSQFDNLVSIIYQDEVNAPKPYRDCEMINIIGEEYLSFKTIEQNFKAYDYFKKNVKSNRKMGHYVLLK
tara:strand:- start:242 stop:1282 length:1041 start_codon:yes stop_codon:yes gene_type:complete